MPRWIKPIGGPPLLPVRGSAAGPPGLTTLPRRPTIARPASRRFRTSRHSLASRTSSRSSSSTSASVCAGLCPTVVEDNPPRLSIQLAIVFGKESAFLVERRHQAAASCPTRRARSSRPRTLPQDAASRWRAYPASSLSSCGICSTTCARLHTFAREAGADRLQTMQSMMRRLAQPARYPVVKVELRTCPSITSIRRVRAARRRGRQVAQASARLHPSRQKLDRQGD